MSGTVCAISSLIFQIPKMWAASGQVFGMPDMHVAKKKKKEKKKPDYSEKRVTKNTTFIEITLFRHTDAILGKKAIIDVKHKK